MQITTGVVDKDYHQGLKMRNSSYICNIFSLRVVKVVHEIGCDQNDLKSYLSGWFENRRNSSINVRFLSDFRYFATGKIHEIRQKHEKCYAWNVQCFTIPTYLQKSFQVVKMLRKLIAGNKKFNHQHTNIYHRHEIKTVRTLPPEKNSQ